MPKKKIRRIEPQRFRLPRGLTRDEAFARAKKRSRRDFRGFKYDPETGEAVLV